MKIRTAILIIPSFFALTISAQAQSVALPKNPANPAAPKNSEKVMLKDWLNMKIDQKGKEVKQSLIKSQKESQKRLQELNKNQSKHDRSLKGRTNYLVGEIKIADEEIRSSVIGAKLGFFGLRAKAGESSKCIENVLGYGYRQVGAKVLPDGKVATGVPSIKQLDEWLASVNQNHRAKASDAKQYIIKNCPGFVEKYVSANHVANKASKEAQSIFSPYIKIYKKVTGSESSK